MQVSGYLVPSARLDLDRIGRSDDVQEGRKAHRLPDGNHSSSHINSVRSMNQAKSAPPWDQFRKGSLMDLGQILLLAASISPEGRSLTTFMEASINFTDN